MRKILLALVVSVLVLFASGASASDESMLWYEQFETACANLLATPGFRPQSTLVYAQIKRMCIESAFDDSKFVAEWGSNKKDQLERALSECRTSVTDLWSCLPLELKKLERQ